jgi:hypothetical protein
MQRIRKKKENLIEKIQFMEFSERDRILKKTVEALNEARKSK